MMTVLFVNHTSLPGGAEHSLVELFRLLPAQGIDPVAVVPHGPLAVTLEAVLADALAPGTGRVVTLPLHALRMPRTTGDALRTARELAGDTVRLRRVMRQVRPAVVHANSAKAAWPAALAARSLGLPCVWHCRDLAPPSSSALMRLCSRVVAISETVERSLPVSPKVVRIVNGIDLAHFDPARHAQATSRQALGLPADGPLVAMVADLIPWKRHDLFLEAAGHIVRQRPNARFVVAGRDRGEHPDLAGALRVQAVALGLMDRIRWLGHCPDTAPLYAAADLLLHPAAEEPFGRVVCEALAMGRPVVVAEGGAPADILKGCPGAGRCARAGDAAAFARAALALLALPPTPDARAHIALRYNIRRTATELATLLQQAAQKG